MVYFIFLSVLLLLFSISRKQQKYTIPIIFLILFVLQAFRAESVGTDTVHYKEYFERIENGYVLPIEIGWILINRLVILFNGSFQHLLIITSLLTLLPIYIICTKHSKNPMLSLFFYYSLYFYFYSFNVSRQLIAVSIILYSYTHLIYAKRKWLFFVFVLLASFFHTSALVALPLYFVNRIPDKKGFYVISILLTAFIGLLLMEYVLNLSSIFGYASYIAKYPLAPFLGNAVYIIIVNVFFIFILYTNNKRGTYFKIFFFYILFFNILARIPFGSRVIFYTSIIQILFLPYYLQNSKMKEKPIIYFIIILYSFVLFFRAFGEGEIFPYYNVLF